LGKVNDSQVVINGLFSLAGVVMGGLLKFFYDRLAELTTQDKLLADKVQAIELLVAGEYVKRDQLERMEEALFAKLDRIEAKLDNKVDK
jgi:hypothetical protein